MCYCHICYYISQRPELLSDARQKSVEIKRKRNNRMLILLATTHFLSLLPLNLFNLMDYAVTTDENPLFENQENMFITYAICHLVSMSTGMYFIRNKYRLEQPKLA